MCELEMSVLRQLKVRGNVLIQRRHHGKSGDADANLCYKCTDPNLTPKQSNTMGNLHNY